MGNFRYTVEVFAPPERIWAVLVDVDRWPEWTPTVTRVQRLEEAGVITGYTAQIDPQRYGYGLSAYVHLKIAQAAWKELRTRLLAVAEVEHAALVSGDSDIVLLVRTRDIAALRELVLNSFQNMPEVLSTQTVLIFDELRSTRQTRSPSAG